MQRAWFQSLESFPQTQPPPPPPPTPIFQSISPSILLIIIILAIIFFVSGLLHLLVRFLVKPDNRDPDELDNVTALQGQLQQLFHLHDAGVDQSFIDILPVFNYKDIIGVKDPFDCAVCLCEFEPEDKLRLLPKCSHAFHTECIDTWLLSHSTCPLCRSSLLPDFYPQSGFTPILCVLESGSDSSREIGIDREGSEFGSNRHLGLAREGELGSSRVHEFPRKSCEISLKEEVTSTDWVVNSGGKIVSVKLGKFRNVDGSGESISDNNNNVNLRRCFSMGSFAYVMDETSSLQVPIRTPAKKPSNKKTGFLPLKPGHRSAISEYGSDSRREFNGIEAFRTIEIHGNGNSDPGSKSERFSFSKIWLRGEKKEKGSSSSNGDLSKRAFSFRFPIRPTISEIEIGGWENGGSENEETQSCYSMGSQAMPLPLPASSTTRRTLLWLITRQQNKVVHSSFSSNV